VRELIIDRSSESVFGDVMLLEKLAYSLRKRGLGVQESLRLAHVALLILLVVLTALPWTYLLAFSTRSLAKFHVQLVLRSLVYFAVIFLLVSVLAVVEWFASRALKARELGVSEAWLWSIIRELEEVTGAGKLRVRLVEEDAPRAFLLLDDVVVSKGLIRALSAEEIKAVLAHELGHRYLAPLRALRGVLTFAVFFNASTILALSLDTNAYYGSLSLPVFSASTVLCFITILSLSRIEEHLVDIYSVKVTKSTALASALSKLERGLAINPPRSLVKPLLMMKGISYPPIKTRINVIAEFHRELSTENKSNS
jgi:Zn-dependent protease with chaperone function